MFNILNLILIIISPIFYCNGLQKSNIVNAIQQKYCNNLSADYVIVGVGTAGALMANQLSGANNSVIALHSGENLTDDPLIKFSRNASITVPLSILDSPIYQNGPTTPQVNANGRSLIWTIALPEGGASSVNAGAWSRETTYIDAKWEAIAGPNWSPNVILSLYKQLENYIGTTENPEFRGFNGPLTIRQFPIITALSQQFTNAVSAGASVPIINDYNDPLLPVGASAQLQYTQVGQNGVFRESSAVAFLNSSVMTPDGFGVNGRKLQVIFNAFALRTIWSSNTAVGVEFLKNGVVQTATAKKGIIVCAGLKSSPFLMYSGIGPRALLQSFNIPVIFDNPNVGQGLVDQPSVYLGFSSDPADTQLPAQDPNGIFSQIAYLPDPTGPNNIRSFRFVTVNPLPGFTLALFDLVQPKSRGYITISSADPTQPPVVNPGYLSNSDDLDLFKRGLQITIANINNSFSNPLYKLIFPDPTILNDDVAVIEFIRENVNQDFHYQSHCAMAPLDQGGVVDSTGRVYINNNGATTNLFVADDSIVPLCMDGSPMATAYLMAANVARMILNN